MASFPPSPREKDIHCFRALFRGQNMFKLAAFPSTLLKEARKTAFKQKSRFPPCNRYKFLMYSDKA
jgi:hypothetical protein